MSPLDLKLHIPKLPDNLRLLDQFISDSELRSGPIKPDNEARIVWAREPYKKTKYSLVYLHGFSASQGEGDPLHRRFASAIGANLYLSRLDSHGKEPRAFSKLTAQSYLDSAVQAIEIGKKLGDKCIVMGNSTGGLLAVYLASKMDGISGLFLYSPLIDFASPNVSLLKKKAVHLVANVFFPNYKLKRENKTSQEISKYWYERYSFKGVISLVELVDACSSTNVFQNVKQPVFMGYYYKSEVLQDPTVSVKAMLAMFDSLGTAEESKRKKVYVDAESHVITSPLTSSVYQDVLEDSLDFFRDVISK